MDGLPRFRAGCVGFLVGNGEEMEFWVMGWYGESRTVSGVFPVDEYYRDGVVLELKSGGKWREIENMWEEGEEGDWAGTIWVLHNIPIEGDCVEFRTGQTEPLLVATGGGDDKGFMWKIGHGDWAKELPGHRDFVTCLAFSSDGKLLASGGFDGLIQVWDITSGSLKCTLEGPGGGIEWVRWHPRGYVVLAGSEDSTAWMWNGDKNVFLNMFSGHSSTITCGDFTPMVKWSRRVREDASLRIRNRNGECVHVVRDHPYHTGGTDMLN
ncbi:hypothetical protein IFM89_022812 [Coptis chinensis]|uniref:Angio-associated migratory cell protein n=1 Tax=Coptis chinensis TaxID=261450 RepID=A0A835HLV3_9MAGN|nr:hypothetical protein IFM89_022812 [Coptis chinensis]